MTFSTSAWIAWRTRPPWTAPPTRRGLRAGFDQIGHGLGLREVELVVEERAARELARLGHAQADVLAGLEAARQQHLHHHRSAMALQLQHFLAGVRIRCREVEREAMIDDIATRIDKRQIGGVARLQRAAAYGAHHGADIGAGNAHDADAAAAWCGGNGGDGNLGCGHGQYCRRSSEPDARCRAQLPGIRISAGAPRRRR
jgi:hypothetical protein